MKSTFLASCLACILTIISSIISIITDNSNNFKIIAISIAIISGIVSLILLYTADREAEYSKRILESLIFANTPIDEMYEEATDILMPIIKEYNFWLRIAHFSIDNIGKVYTIQSYNEPEIEEQLFLSKKSAIRAYLAPPRKRFKIIKQDVLEDWKKFKLGRDWDTIREKCTSIIRYRVIEVTKGVVTGFAFNEEQNTIFLLLHEGTGAGPLVGQALVLSKDDLLHLLNQKALYRVKYIWSRVDAALSKIFDQT